MSIGALIFVTALLEIAIGYAISELWCRSRVKAAEAVAARALDDQDAAEQMAANLLEENDRLLAECDRHRIAVRELN